MMLSCHASPVLRFQSFVAAFSSLKPRSRRIQNRFRPQISISSAAMNPTSRQSGPVEVEMEDAVSQSPSLARAVQLVVAVCNDGGIGFKGTLPWKIPTDMKHFRTLTSVVRDPSKRNAVVMGRHTWSSIPLKYRPLKDRLNVVLSQSGAVDVTSDVILESSLEAALQTMAAKPYDTLIETVFVIGGAGVFQQALSYKECWALHLTRIEANYECDVYWRHKLEPEFQLYSAAAPVLDTSSSRRCTFMVYTRKGMHERVLPPAAGSKHEEHQYLDCVGEILTQGAVREDRTGTGTISKFGAQMRYNLRHTFPLLTTKRVFWKGVVEELLWFISGSTNAADLQRKGVHIWDGNASREFLDRVGLTHRGEGDLGPVYGFQWRHFGAYYTDMHEDYTGKGVDQLAEVVRKLRENPADRRIVLSAWNPADLKLMALPPCHMFCQFYVAHGELSCQMYQRSCDMGLGVPFNIASYALLTCMLAQVTGLKRGDFIHTLGDAHAYLNHVEPLKKQLTNKPRPFPVLEIDPSVKEIDDFDASKFQLHNYEPHNTIKMKLAV